MAAAGGGLAERLVKEALLTTQSNYIMLQKITVLGALSGQHVSATERGIRYPPPNPGPIGYLCHNLTLRFSCKLNCSKEETCFQGKCLLFPFKAVLHPADQRYLSPCKITTNLHTRNAVHFMGPCYDGSFVLWGKGKC